MKRWSKLKKQVESLLIPGVKVYWEVYRMKSQYGTCDLPRFYISKGRGDNRELLYSYPDGWKKEELFSYSWKTEDGLKGQAYPYKIPNFSQLLRDYINSPYPIDIEDEWGLYAILKSLDRRKSK